jgi:esterase
VNESVPADELIHLRRAAEVAAVEIEDVVLPTDKQAVLGGMRFHYLDWGNEDRRPVVFLHGGGLNAHTYDLVCLALRPDHHCIALDLRGHGDSEWSPVVDYRIETNAADVAAFLDHLALPDPVLVGMSLGGLTALHYAGDHSMQLAGLVVIDIGPQFQREGSKKIRDFLAAPAEHGSVEDFVRAAKAFNPRRDEVLLRRSLLHNLRRTPRGTWVWKWDPRPRVATDHEARDRRYARLWESVDRIRCPTLVVRGAQSEIFLEADAEALATRLPSARWTTVENAGHTVQGDNPAGLLAALRPFLAEVAR